MRVSQIRLALFEPEIPQNAGTLMRLGACLNVPVDIIEPCGFVLHERRMRRAGMDYLTLANMTRHHDWASFYDLSQKQGKRLILLEPSAPQTHLDFSFQPQDILLLGQESSGFSDAVHTHVPLKVRIPMQEKARSLNVAVAGALVLGEALRQVNGYPKEAHLLSS